MTDEAGPSYIGCGSDSSVTSWCDEVQTGHSRRRLLRHMTVGGTMALAGCGLFGPDAATNPPTTPENQGVTDQTFRLPVESDPNRASFYAPGFEELLEDTTYALTPKEPPSFRLWRFIREPGIWVNYWWVGAETYYNWLEKPIVITPTEVTLRIRDDATWSDGQPVTGKDIVVYPFSQLLWRHFPPHYMVNKKEEPTKVLGAFDDFEIGNKSVTYRSSNGYFDQFWDMTITTRFGLWGMAGDATFPTHIEPYGAFCNGLIETVRRAQAGEINPWKGWDNAFIKPDAHHRKSLVEKHLAKEGKFAAKFSKPKNVVSNSAWDLAEINGPEAVFQPNPHHRNANDNNFEEVILEYTPSAKRQHAALSAGRLDYANGYKSTPTPQSVVDALPDDIRQLLFPGNLYSGNEIGLNFSHPALGKRSVRAAMLYAIDTPTIAKNIHESTAKPVTIPGGQSWDATTYARQAFIDEKFITYTQDKDRAANLMRTAGYRRDGGKWRNSDDEPITLTLAARGSTPRWEPTVASQLSAFGIETTVKTMGKTTFETRTKNGDFPMWSHWGVSTNSAAVTLLFWFLPINEARQYNIYPRQQFGSGSFSKNGYPTPRTEERWSVFTIEAPPVGEPDGDLVEYHPSAMTLAFYNDPPGAEFRDRVKTAMWLANWHLPTLPINKTLQQHFIDEAHWEWPVDSPQWETFSNAGPKLVEGIFASGAVRANSDNP